MTSQHILSDDLREKLTHLCQTNDITTLKVFGSYARGEATDESDLDLLAKFSKRKSLLEIVRLERLLSDVLNNKVDLLTEASLSPYLRDKVIREARTVYGGQG